MTNNCSLYPVGQCTWYVCSHWPHPIGPVWGNATDWIASARAAGYLTGTTPELGAIAVWGANDGGALAAGHVALVTALEPLTVTGEDWPVGAGEISYVIGSPGAPGTPTGYIYAPAEREVDEMLTLDGARALVWQQRLTLFGVAALGEPNAQAAIDSYASRIAGGENAEGVLTSMVTDAQRDPRLLAPFRVANGSGGH